MGISLSIDIKGVKNERYGNDLLGSVSAHVDGPGIFWIQGSNGSGKSTLTSILSGKAFIGENLDIQGTVCLCTPEGRTYTPTSPDFLDYVRQVAYLPQRVGSSFLATHHQDDICFGIEGRFPHLLGDTNSEKDKDAIAWLQPVLEALDAWNHLPRRTGQSSYGESRRMEFACAAAPHASLVILDEPFSGLDPHWRQTLASAISRLASSYPSIWVITAHETPEKLGVNLSPKTTVALEPQVKSHDSFLAITELAVQQFRNCPLNKENQLAFQAHDVTVDRRRSTGARVVLQQLKACPGKLTWIEGDNGAGKSTICAVLAGLLKTTRGAKVNGEVNGGCVRRNVPTAPNEIIRLALQDPYKSFVYRTVKEDLLSVCAQKQSQLEHAKDGSLEPLVQQLEGHWGSLDRKPATLSFGQLRFLQLLLFPLSARVLIFDEPLLGLAPSLHEPLLNALRKIAATGRTVICTCYNSGSSGLATDEPVYRLTPTSSGEMCGGNVRRITAADVWFARTQPYGYWRACNPLVKLVPVLLMLVASTIWSPALLLQGVVLSEFMLLAPFNSRSRAYVVGLNVGIGVCLLALLTPSIGLAAYADIQSKMMFEIPGYVTVDGFFSVCIVFMMVSLFRVRRAFSSRDYAWLVGLFPGSHLKMFFGETVYAHTYGWLQLPRLIAEVNTSLRSRGVRRPSFFRFFHSLNAAIDELGLWVLYVFRQMREMALLVEFFVMSRVRLDTRRTPVGRQLSQADLAMLAVFTLGVLAPWVVSLSV